MQMWYPFSKNRIELMLKVIKQKVYSLVCQKLMKDVYMIKCTNNCIK